jgi:hypothetical protein
MLHFFVIKRKNRGLNTKRLHKNLLGIILLSKIFGKILMEMAKLE